MPRCSRPRKPRGRDFRRGKSRSRVGRDGAGAVHSAAVGGAPQDRRMVFIWGSGWGPRRRRGFGPPPGWGGGYGPPPGYGYGGQGYGRRGYGGGGGSCLRDLLLLDAGCCIAESLGCGANMVLLAPTFVFNDTAAT